MADELGSGDLLLGAMPKKFQILKKTRIGFLTILSKIMNFLMNLCLLCSFDFQDSA